jgi:hypothetical protein
MLGVSTDLVAVGTCTRGDFFCYKILLSPFFVMTKLTVNGESVNDYTGKPVDEEMYRRYCTPHALVGGDAEEFRLRDNGIYLVLKEDDQIMCHMKWDGSGPLPEKMCASIFGYVEEEAK